MDEKISSLSELTAPDSLDELVIVDKSDTTMAATGTDKKITRKTLTPEHTVETTTVGESIALYEGTDNGANKVTLKAPDSIASDKTLTLPDATDTLVGKDTTDTLTNKTLTSPKIGTAIADTNGNEVIKTPATASAINEITVTNAATGNAPQIAATGDDTNIDLKIKAKGTGVTTKTVKRQGGSATSWTTAGTTNYTEEDVFIQVGSVSIQATNAFAGHYYADVAVTFPVAFSEIPLVFVTSQGATDGNPLGIAMSVTTTGCIIRGLSPNDANSSAEPVGWMAIGKR